MTGSLTVLYNISILIAWMVQRKRTAADADAAESSDGDDDEASSTALAKK